MPIRVLDAETVSSIAAGEVIERPFSVAKELIENALDAGAKSITVEIRGGGIEYLRVTDNGSGIPAGQVRLAFENHATSKLTRPEDLNDIRTLGFRGEALPSIASVSRIEMLTRPSGADIGMRYTSEGAANVRCESAGCPEGTSVIVRDLFFNVPVRRAFLKKPAYEGAQVQEVVQKMILGNTGIAFRFINNGKQVYHSFGDGKLRNAVFAVYGRETAENMLEIDAASGGMRIQGMFGIGDLAKPTRAYQSFFINGRSVRCPMLNQALERAMTERVTIGKYPMCALSLTLPPASVDVNVHPSKLEVRFRDEAVMRETVEEMLRAKFQGEKMLDIQRDSAPKDDNTGVSRVQYSAPAIEPVPTPLKRVSTASDKPLQQSKVFQDTLLKEVERIGLAHPVSALREADDMLTPVQDMATQKRPMPDFPEKSALTLDRSEKTERSINNFKGTPSETDHSSESVIPYHIIGTLYATYILLETEEALLLIDQHAAHERIRYEHYLKELQEGVASQELLIPITVHLTMREMAILIDNLDILADAGYIVDIFGESDIQIRAVPFVLGQAEVRPLFTEMITSLDKLKSATFEARLKQIRQISCKGAVKGGDKLTDSEIRALIDEMQSTNAPPTCPHGRPIVKAISKREIERMFKRIQ